MSETRGSFWSYAWKNTNYKRSRFARNHNNIYTRQKKDDGESVLQKAQDGWNYMSNYIMTGKGND